MNGRSSRSSPDPEIFAAGIPPHHLKEPGRPPWPPRHKSVAVRAQAWQPRARTRSLARCNYMECMEDRAPEGLCQRPRALVRARPRSPVFGILHLRGPDSPAVRPCPAPGCRERRARTNERDSQRPSRRWTNPERLTSSPASFGPRTDPLPRCTCAGHATFPSGMRAPISPAQPPNPRVASTARRYASTWAAICAADQPMPGCAAMSRATRSATASPPSIAS